MSHACAVGDIEGKSNRPVQTALSGRFHPEHQRSANISADGERIYHVPGQKFYSVTKITDAKGERWFCDEDEAPAAG